MLICQNYKHFFLDFQSDVRFTQSWSSSSQEAVNLDWTQTGFHGTPSSQGESPAHWDAVLKVKLSGVVKASIGRSGFSLARAQQVCS
jgi:hypothetical protein